MKQNANNSKVITATNLRDTLNTAQQIALDEAIIIKSNNYWQSFMHLIIGA